MADTGNSRIQVFSPDGHFIGKWGSRGPGDDQFIMPQDLAIDSKDNIYISDVGVAHEEVGYIERILEEMKDLTQGSCQ